MGAVVHIPLKNNYIISDKLFFNILNRLIESENYRYHTDIEYSSTIDDSIVYKICSGKDELTITRQGSNDAIIKLHGEKAVIRQFLHDLAIEATTMIFTELCANAFKCEHEKLEAEVYNKIKMTMDGVFKEQS